MKHCNTPEHQTTRRVLPIASAAAFAVAFAVSLPQFAHAGQVITVPPVPANIAVDAGNKPFLVGHAIGTQNYVCLPSATSATGVAYALFTPEATLFDDDDKQIITHYFSPNPFEKNTSPALVAVGPIRATWQDKDTSTIWGKVRPADPNVPGDLGDSSTDARFVAKGAIAWLKVTATGTEDGPTGGDKLTKTTFVQRLSTVGGVAPSTGCDTPADVGHQAFVPYTADYFFYSKDSSN